MNFADWCWFTGLILMIYFLVDNSLIFSCVMALFLMILSLILRLVNILKDEQ